MGVDGKGHAGGLARGRELASTSGEQGQRTGRRSRAARFSSGPHHYGEEPVPLGKSPSSPRRGGAGRSPHRQEEQGGARAERKEAGRMGKDATTRPDAGGEAAPYESRAVEGALRQERCSAAPSPPDLGGA